MTYILGQYCGLVAGNSPTPFLAKRGDSLVDEQVEILMQLTAFYGWTMLTADQAFPQAAQGAACRFTGAQSSICSQ